MDKEKLESLLIDYIDGKLADREEAIVEKELRDNETAFQRYEQLKSVIQQMNDTALLEPSPSLKANFEKALQSEVSSSKKGRQVFLQPIFWRVAAGIILVMAGIVIGFRINKNHEQQLAFARLREEMNATKQLMMTMMDNQQSASQRIMGVTASYQLINADDEIVTALVKTMNEDSNTNVRLAALEALSKFLNQAHVRKALIESLTKQKDPVVQISLIQLLVKMKETSVVKELDQLTKQRGILPAVKDEAYAGILKLS